MDDVEIIMDDAAEQLALFGETLGDAGIGVEGGGMFTVDGRGVAHFLVEDGPIAVEALQRAGITGVTTAPVVTTRLAQDEFGQLGAFCRAMADAHVTIRLLYSDHDGNLILLVDDPDIGRELAESWGS